MRNRRHTWTTSSRYMVSYGRNVQHNGRSLSRLIRVSKNTNFPFYAKQASDFLIKYPFNDFISLYMHQNSSGGRQLSAVFGAEPNVIDKTARVYINNVSGKKLNDWTSSTKVTGWQVSKYPMKVSPKKWGKSFKKMGVKIVFNLTDARKVKDIFLKHATNTEAKYFLNGELVLATKAFRGKSDIHVHTWLKDQARSLLKPGQNIIAIEYTSQNRHRQIQTDFQMFIRQ